MCVSLCVSHYVCLTMCVSLCVSHYVCLTAASTYSRGGVLEVLYDRAAGGHASSPSYNSAVVLQKRKVSCNPFGRSNIVQIRYACVGLICVGLRWWCGEEVFISEGWCWVSRCFRGHTEAHAELLDCCDEECGRIRKLAFGLYMSIRGDGENSLCGRCFMNTSSSSCGFPRRAK